jgi:ElaA protein
MYKIKHFRDLNTNEFYEIAKARYEVFACEQHIFEENDFDDVDKNCYHIFYENNDKIIAYARIIPKEFSSYEDTSIGRVLVLDEARGRGIAREMMIEAVRFVQNDLKEKHITLSAQEYIKTLYSSIGFKEISETYNECSIPHVKMRL